ncbi:MAG: primosomal protein N' [Desulfonatronovibrionaceae bacterium]
MDSGYSQPQSTMTTELWTVALLSPPYSELTYGPPEHFPPGCLEPGMRAVIPLGASDSFRLAVILNLETEPPQGRLKRIVWPLDRKPILSRDYLDLARDMSLRHAAPLGRVLANMLPLLIKDKPDCLLGADGSRFGFRALQSDRGLVREWLDGRLTPPPFRPRRENRILDAAKEPPWDLLPNAKRQREIMDFIWTRGGCSPGFLARRFGPGVYPVLKRLRDKGLLAFSAYDPAAETGQLADSVCTPSEQQKKAVGTLLPELWSGNTSCSVLHGVTGSGKTLVYAELARAALDGGEDVLVLAPEIALARQLRDVLQAHLPGREVLLHHGGLSPSCLADLFLKLSKRPCPRVLVGTRSSLFMVTYAPKLVILDEEHDESFKQDSNLVYQAKEVGYFWVRRSRGLLVLGSATPDVKTYWAASRGDIKLVDMPSRISGKELPTVELVDLNNSPRCHGPLAEEVHQALMHTLERGEQAVIMHNRRGYAPLLYCQNCQEIARCQDCHVSLTYHKKRNRLVCHYCGATASLPLVCEHCGYSAFIPMGEGTEKLEEYFSAHLNDAGVLRLDRDSARKKGRGEEILRQFSAGEASVLVGTQMISKGHNFPGVTLVIVVDGDLGLNLPDYRASERVFQMLVQVSGRSGRGELPGRVLIQTSCPGHYCWQHIRNGDYESFFSAEISRRKRFLYPPFCRMGLVRCTFPWEWRRRNEVLKQFSALSERLAKKYGLGLLGPAPAPMHKLNGRERHQCLLKADQWPEIRAFFHELRQGMQPFRECRVMLDLDPLNML